LTDNKALLKAFTVIARREQRERIAKGLAVVKAAKKEGLLIRSATIENVTLEFGEAEAGGKWDHDEIIKRLDGLNDYCEN
jgi:hypothetical protein